MTTETIVNAADCGADEHLNSEEADKIADFVSLVNSDEWKRRGGDKDEIGLDEVGVWTMKKQGSPLILVKGAARMDVALDKLFRLLADKDLFDYFMKILDPMYRDGQVLSMPTPKHQVAQAAYRLPTPFLADRDFLWMNLLSWTKDKEIASVCWSIEEEELLTAGLVNKESLPDRKEGDVRGWISLTGIHAREDADGTSFVSYIVQADARGMIPIWLQNMVADSQAENVRRARDHFRKEKEQPTEA